MPGEHFIITFLGSVCLEVFLGILIILLASKLKLSLCATKHLVTGGLQGDINHIFFFFYEIHRAEKGKCETWLTVTAQVVTV